MGHIFECPLCGGDIAGDGHRAGCAKLIPDAAQAVGKLPEWHTPLPWAATTRQGSWDWVIYSTKDPNIEICQLFHDGTEDNETGEANADLIVRAVNALAAQPPAAPVETKRKTFTIPPGHEAVRDSEGRATGEVRPRLSAGNVELLIENLIQSAVEYENNCDRLVAKTIRVELEKAKQAIRDALTLAQPQTASKSIGVESLADWFYDNGHEFVVSDEEEVSRALLDVFDISRKSSPMTRPQEK